MALTDPAQFRAWNEDMARRHDPDLYHRCSPLPVRWLERQRVSRLLALLEARADERVLEVGCGAGNVLEQVASRRKVGIDLSEFLLGKARDRVRDGAALLRMDAAHLAFREGSFDKVYCSEVLEHVLDPRQVLGEIRRVLRSGGCAVVSVPDERRIDAVKRLVFALPGLRRLLASREGYRVPERMQDEWHLHEFDEARLRRDVEGLFRIEQVLHVPTRLLPLRLVARLAPV